MVKFRAAFEQDLADGQIEEARQRLTEAEHSVRFTSVSRQDRLTVQALLRDCHNKLRSATQRAKAANMKSKSTDQSKRRGTAPTPSTKICCRCGKFFKPPVKNPRRRRCSGCFNESSVSVKTESAGLPTLGKRK
jgi:hypothetical protein